MSYIVLRYDTQGNQIGEPLIFGFHTSGEARGVRVSETGEVYVGGSLVTPHTGGLDFVVVKFDASGVFQWYRYFNAVPNSGDSTKVFCMDKNGIVWLGGRSYTGPVSLGDYMAIGFDAAGNQFGPYGYNGPGNAEDCITAMCFNSTGDHFFTGRSVGSGSGQDYATVGNIFPVQRYNGPANGDDGATAMAIDNHDLVYVTGYSSGLGRDWLTIKYGPNGETTWTVRFNGPGNGDDTPVAVGVDSSGGVIVAGQGIGPNNNNDIFIIKYRKPYACTYLPGDINGDGRRVGGDVTYGVRYFKGIGTPPRDSCFMDSTGTYLYVAGDVNGDCQFRGPDITRLVAYFKGIAQLQCCHFFPVDLPPLRHNGSVVPSDQPLK